MIRRDAIAVAIVLVMLFSAIPIVLSEGSDAVPQGEACDGVLIYEAASKYGSDNKDGLSLKNYGSSSVNLKNYYLVDFDSADSKHTFTITSNISLGPGEIAVFVEANDGSWFCESTPTRHVYTFTEAGTKGSSFVLSNSGDYLHLYNASGTYLDTVVYGKSSIPSRGWDGPAVDMGYMEEAVRRVERTDTNTYFDWTPAAPGYTSNSFYDVPTFNGATVTPFIFPDAGGKPIYEAVMGAQTSVSISIYMLTSKYMISELAYLAEQGKDVRIMLEKKPLGYDHDFGLLKAMSNKGVQVCLIGDGGSGVDRYSYVHNKYAVIDDSKVIVTSENWTGPNLGDGKGNRGWGAVIQSAGYAGYMNSYFENDFNGGDIMTLAQYEAANGSITPSTLYTHSQVQSFVNGISYSSTSYAADIRMYMSPDNTFKALQYYIDNANTRVYTEQMDLGASYYDAEGESASAKFNNISPLTAMINASNRGVDARFLLLKSCDRIGAVDDLNSMTNVKAGAMSPSGYATMHNKGVIIDDAVWLSSVNWTDNSFSNNRECGLYIMSPQVADFYAAAYSTDWEHDYKFSDILTLRPTFNSDNSVKLAVTTAVGECEWTINYKDGSKETQNTSSGEIVIADFTKVQSVRVSAGSDTGRYVFDGVIDTPEAGNEIPPAAIGGGAAVIAVIILAIIIRFLKSRK